MCRLPETVWLPVNGIFPSFNPNDTVGGVIFKAQVQLSASMLILTRGSDARFILYGCVLPSSDESGDHILVSDLKNRGKRKRLERSYNDIIILEWV